MDGITNLFDSIMNAITNLSSDQLVALFIGICAFGVAKNVVKEGISLIMSVIGVLFVLYFAAPDVYYQVFDIIKNLVGAVTGSGA